MPIRNYLRSGAFVGMDGAAQRNGAASGEGAAHSHFYLQTAIRLFRAQAAPVYRGKVHELAELYFEDLGLAVGDLPVAIHHYGKLDMARDRAKQAAYFRLAQAEARTRPLDLQVQYNVIQEGLLVEAWADVLQAAEVYRTSTERAPMLVWLGGGLALQGLGRHQEALAWFEQILRQKPGHAPALGARAESLGRLGRAEEAQADYLQAMEADPGYTLPFLKLAGLLEEAQDPVSARAVLEAGLDQNPKDLTLWEALVGLSAKQRDPRVAQDALDALRAVPDGGKTIWHQLVIHALRAAGNEAGARVILDLGLAAFPGDPELLALGRP
jgi:tetratricopeptide (TPR) repeat protein